MMDYDFAVPHWTKDAAGRRHRGGTSFFKTIDGKAQWVGGQPATPATQKEADLVLETRAQRLAAASARMKRGM